MVNDLACAKEVKQKYAERRLTGESICSCPAACHTFDYEFSVSQAKWPSPGYETSYAYDKLITMKKTQWIKMFEKANNGSMDLPINRNPPNDTDADEESTDDLLGKIQQLKFECI